MKYILFFIFAAVRMCAFIMYIKGNSVQKCQHLKKRTQENRLNLVREKLKASVLLYKVVESMIAQNNLGKWPVSGGQKKKYFQMHYNHPQHLPNVFVIFPIPLETIQRVYFQKLYLLEDISIAIMQPLALCAHVNSNLHN